jgi:hypothetical protein
MYICIYISMYINPNPRTGGARQPVHTNGVGRPEAQSVPRALQRHLQRRGARRAEQRGVRRGWGRVEARAETQGKKTPIP